MILNSVLFCNSQLKIRPDLHYADPECPVTVAENFPKGEDLFFEIELLDFHKVKVSEFLALFSCISWIAMEHSAFSNMFLHGCPRD